MTPTDPARFPRGTRSRAHDMSRTLSARRGPVPQKTSKFLARHVVEGCAQNSAQTFCADICAEVRYRPSLQTFGTDDR